MALYQCKQHKQTNSETQVRKIKFVGEVIWFNREFIVILFFIQKTILDDLTAAE